MDLRSRLGSISCVATIPFGIMLLASCSTGEGDEGAAGGTALAVARGGATSSDPSLGRGGSTSPVTAGPTGGLNASRGGSVGSGGETMASAGCPASVPSASETCNEPLPCVYGNSRCYCTTGHWSCLTSQSAQCPAAQPVQGSACTEKTINCNYGTASCVCSLDPNDATLKTILWNCQ